MVETVVPPPRVRLLDSNTNQLPTPSEYRFLQKDSSMVETMDGDHRHHDGMSTFLPAFLGLSCRSKY